MAAPRSDAVAEVMEAVAAAGGTDSLATLSYAEAQSARRVEALSLRMAGLSYETIATRMKTDPGTVEALVNRALQRAETRAVEGQRSLENERLDRAQAAIWPGVLRGDTKAIGVFLNISSARRQLNGLNAPQRMEVAVGIRTEMQDALANLEALMLSDENTFEGEVVPNDRT